MTVSRPVVYGSLAAIVLASVWYLGQEPEPVSPSTKKKVVKVEEKTEGDFVQADYTARFTKPKVKLRNVFLPLVTNAEAQPAQKPTEADEDLLKIPGNLADGDGNWSYTGFVIVDEQRMALLENGSTKKGAYVKEGQPWKTSTVRRITAESIVFVDKQGTEAIVLRAGTNPPKKAPTAENPRPVDLSSALKGPIGPQNIRIVPSPPAGMPAGIVMGG
jgi:hypothetical protein